MAGLVATLMTVLAGITAPAHASFGIAAFDQQIQADASGSAFSQAGGHPYAISTDIDLNKLYDYKTGGVPRDPDAKDVIVELPPGLFGNPAATAQCTLAQLVPINPVYIFAPPECPIGSQVGTIILKVEFLKGHVVPLATPLFNMVPPTSAPAQFGFNVLGVPITLEGNVRNGGDFGVNVGSYSIPMTLPLAGIEVTFWGVPADPSHDHSRCHWYGFYRTAECENQGEYATPQSDPEPPRAFLTMPTSCTAAGSMETRVIADSWAEPGVWFRSSVINHAPPAYPLQPSEWGAPLGVVGCEQTPFRPSISVQPTNAQADTPSGLNIDIALPQDGLLNPSGLATADVKKAVVTLPEGESVSPSAADGLGSCTPAQIGLDTGAPATCPNSSKLGSVELETPLLNSPLHGSVYLGKPECGPCGVADDLAGRLLKLYIVIEGHGVILKLPGRVELDPVNGQITTTFDNNPQLPFSHLKLDFKAGPRSPLVNPRTCGTFMTRAELTPWSGNPAVTVETPFQIASGPEGRPCPSATQAFAPGFAAGTTNNQAGAFSPFSLTFSRTDGEQQLGGVSVKLPIGLIGTLSGIPLCEEPAATAGTCSPASEIGSLVVGTGAGANPFYVTGGKVFLTTAYKGAPFGLSVVVAAKAGPFDLGTVVVRGTVGIDPHTAQLTVTTDPLPTILDGIPLDLRAIHVSIDKSGFIFNPTNCDPMSLGGTLSGGAGGIEQVSNGFQVTNCGALKFQPRFSVSTSGKTSRKAGASLAAKLAYPKTPQGTEANIAKVKVSLPKQLPSRLTTLQKACPAETFETNPAACPAASRIGAAKAITPVLPVPLTGPVYFVSHGGEAFPDLVVVLQGYGVTVNLIGTTFISKAGITSTTFKQVPDVPVGSFELHLPQGPNSALAANGNLCASRLKMPTTFIAQDGAQIHTNTSINTTGCTKHRTRKHHKHSSRSRHRKK
jgi:hypothetical protein